ncbi:hypothetical protein GW17_00006189 [Ensete ventricosum]|nr:hypothetical protein GW17_00006189 [Ensete ventricosum]RZR86371.1 hypothetical protein BHM03_00013568 [Ensete ventricosum]
MELFQSVCIEMFLFNFYRELLISFRKATGQKPLRIIFYRDGVSEGQFYQVLLHEVDAIRKVDMILSFYAMTIYPPAYYAHLAAFRARFYVDRNISENSPAPSMGSVKPLPALKEKVKQVMSYC